MRCMKRKTGFLAAVAILLGAAAVARAQEQQPAPKGDVVEDIVARVNDDIITSHQFQQAKEALRQEVKQDCSGCTQTKVDAEYKQQETNVLRDLIDQSLLLQRANDEGINVDADVIKQLDSVRQANKLDSMDALQKAVEGSGLNWEDYKDSIRKRLLTSQVIQRDVGGTIQIDRTEVKKYYDEHKSEFTRPETVVLREIFLSTKGKTPKEVEEIKKKIDNLRARVQNGDDFGQLAKLFSEGSTAKNGGELGSFQRDQLAKVLADPVFKLQHNQMTPVIQTPQGYELIQVERHYEAGLQPIDAVDNEIENALYSKKVGPALRDFLKELRKESYIRVKPGFVDTAAVAETPIEEVVPGSDSDKSKKKAKGHE
jgi:peptidyl-prolyl cis-trans isomerase SurA